MSSFVAYFTPTIIGVTASIVLGTVYFLRKRSAARYPLSAHDDRMEATYAADYASDIQDNSGFNMRDSGFDGCPGYGAREMPFNYHCSIAPPLPENVSGVHVSLHLLQCTQIIPDDTCVLTVEEIIRGWVLISQARQRSLKMVVQVQAAFPILSLIRRLHNLPDSADIRVVERSPESAQGRKSEI